MPIRHPSISYREPEKAQQNWTRIERTAPREILAPLSSLLKGSADPDAALNYFERFNSNAPERIVHYLTRNPAALNVLIPLFSQSHFLSETLLTHPEYVEWLCRDKRIEFVKSKEDLLEELSRFEATLGDMDLAERLVRFKRREYLRIALRDVTKIATLAETTWELSALAEIVLEKALRWCDQTLRNRYGVPRYVDAAGRIAPSEFVVLALGKLGGNELNYSSDIDVMYLYSHDGETDGIEGRSETQISNQEYFIKLSSAINEAVSRVTPAGWAFRVDLRLRPQGREGFLSRSVKSAIAYYDRHAQPWELQALLKARPVAGGLSVGKQFLHSLQSRIYPVEDQGRIVESLEQMRIKLDEKLQRNESSGFNVKLERGTIRDIEFFTQCLQRIYGSHDLWVRESNTVLALRRLHDNNHLGRPEFFTLASAYEFFRIIEHRLQLDRGQQTHTLSNLPSEQQVLALRMGFEDSGETSAREALLHAIEYHRGNVLRISEQVLEQSRVKTVAPSKEFRRGEEEEGAPGVRGDNELSAALRQLDKLLPGLAAGLREMGFEKGAGVYFHLFLEALIAKGEALGDFKMDSNQSRRLEILFASGSTLCETMIRSPEWVLPCLGKPEVRARSHAVEERRRIQPLARRDKKGSRSKPTRRDPSSGAAGVNLVRQETRRRVFQILADDVLRQPPLAKSLQRLSEVAGRALLDSLALAGEQVRGRFTASLRKLMDSPKFHFGIFGLGRLAGNELDIGSDLDLVFVCDYSYFKSREAVREVAFRLAETVVSILTSYTREGPLYPVDLRLRPSGKEGELVQDATYLIEYFRGIAQSWEHAAFLKLRPLAGDIRWAKSVSKNLTNASFAAVEPHALREDLWDIRTRLEDAAAFSKGSFNLKKGRGGVYDIEFALAYSHLINARPYRPGSTLHEAVEFAHRIGILSGSAAAVFQEALPFYRSLDHCLRLMKGKSTHLINQEIVKEIPEPLWGRIASAMNPSSSGNRSTCCDRVAELMEFCGKTASLVRRELERTFEKVP
jgi:[glutamine synthetase] adenylyltransferase / [glutamine synthetase]-adenylyl-L-tyrosine phosphorylase